jgi:hypothetical protein
MRLMRFCSMSDYDRGLARPGRAGTADMAVDAGLRAFMLSVYNKVALGLLLSAALAYVTSSVPAVRDLLFTVKGNRIGYTLLGNIVAFAPLVILLLSAFVFKDRTARTSGIVYWAIAALFGASLGAIALAYTGASIAMTFLITASAFGGLSLWGYATKRNLSAFGSFLMVGLIGLVIASIVNMFVLNSALYFIINVVGVLIFAGLIAYDTQRLKMTYYQVGGDREALGAASNWGALSLYLDFVNLFLFLLRLFGSRR